MDTASAKRVSELEALAKLKGEELPDHLDNLPGEAHIVSGVIEGHGANEIASEKARLSSKTVKLVRTASGGVEYQLAIFVSEPTPAPKVEEAPKEDPKFLEAVEYFVGKGLSDGDARKKVNQFGVPRVLAAKDKELDDELAKLVEKKD